MKIIINTSTLYVGGGVQVAVSFLNELNTFDENNEYHIFMSKEIQKQIDYKNFNNKFTFYIIENTPASLKHRNDIKKELDILEKKIQPDIVFTVFGPSYWKPKSIHLVGFADGWVYNPDSIAYKRLSFFRRLKMKLHCIYKAYYLKKDSDYFVLETNDAKNKISKIVKLNKENIFVVGNTYGSVFENSTYLDSENENYIKLPKKTNFRLMYIAHNHVSKNLIILKKLLNFFEKNNIEMILTIDKESYKTLFPTNPANIINIGPISQKSCPSIYAQADALFAPTILETFSAAYPEAMKMEIPILTSDYSFSRDVCHDAALYFNPLDEKDIMIKIEELMKNHELKNKLIENGKKQLVKFETSQIKAKKYIKICENIINKEKKNVQK